MRVLVVGASKGIGRQTVKAALAQGHEVTAFSRNPSKLDIKHPKLKLRSGNALDTKSLEQIIPGHDVIICALGLPTLKAIGPPFAGRSYVLSKGTKNILDNMRATKVKRYICVTAIGTGDSVKQCTPLARIVLRYGLRWLFKEKDAQENLIRSSVGIDWTIIRPTAITNGRKKGAMIGEDLPSGVLTHISRADVAEIMVGMINQKSSYKKALVLSYPPRLGDSLRWIVGYFGKG